MTDGDAKERTLDLLAQVRSGDPDASERLLPIVYSELRAMARHQFQRERAGHTLQPTVVVHEAFLKLVGADIDWESRRHFLCLAARGMRRILREHARARGAARREGDWQRVSLVDVASGEESAQYDLGQLDDALTELAELNDRHARVVELRYFAELTIAETAEALGVSTGTVENDWRFARAWLSRRLDPPATPS